MIIMAYKLKEKLKDNYPETNVVCKKVGNKYIFTNSEKDMEEVTKKNEINAPYLIKYSTRNIREPRRLNR